MTTDVLIVGAGPTGLSLAAQLTRYGIGFVLCDRKEGPTDQSRALVVHARSLEIYDQFGLARPAIEGGQIAQNVALLHDGKEVARLELGRIGGTLSPFPFLLIFEQSKNERLLGDYLAKAGETVRWRTELTALTPSGSGVEARLRSADGETLTIQARYLVGCDGAGSATRHLLELGFEGSTYPRLFYVADVEAEFEAARDCVYAAFGRDSFALLVPLEGDGHWRLIGPLPGYDPERPGDLSFEQVAPIVQALVRRPLAIRSVRWFSTYKVHTRHAQSFSRGRCFLAGDAAHIHTPAGGQGMNTGIQDAYNLAWKLALAVRGRARDTLLESYDSERLANARRLLATTDELFDVLAGEHWYTGLFRDHVLPPLARFAWRFDAVKEFLFPTLSQIGIRYPDSPLSWHEGGQDFSVRAGDRLPFIEVDGVSLYDRLHAPRFHLLAFSDSSQKERAGDDLLERHALRLTPSVRERFGADGPFQVLVRPDHHIGYIRTGADGESLDAYFAAIGIRLDNPAS